tara:strand:+ start:423 stop:728 length:306 start_codon:yes stop_codon:yes gene_type:complete
MFLLLLFLTYFKVQFFIQANLDKKNNKKISICGYFLLVIIGLFVLAIVAGEAYLSLMRVLSSTSGNLCIDHMSKSCPCGPRIPRRVRGSCTPAPPSRYLGH